MDFIINLILLLLISYFSLFLLYVIYLNHKMKEYDLTCKKSRIVFSLTTSPTRLPKIDETLDSLVNQKIQPDAIYLNVPKIFKRTGETYAQTQLERIQNKYPTVIINPCEDIGPITKLIPTLDKEKDPDTIIVVVDDDTLYPKKLLNIIQHDMEIYDNVVYSGSATTLYFSKPIAEGFSSIALKRKLIKDDITLYLNNLLDNKNCFRSDDYVISNYFYLNKIRIKKLSFDMIRNNYPKIFRNSYFLKYFLDYNTITAIKQIDVGFQSDALHQIQNHKNAYQQCAQFAKSIYPDSLL